MAGFGEAPGCALIAGDVRGDEDALGDGAVATHETTGSPTGSRVGLLSTRLPSVIANLNM